MTEIQQGRYDSLLRRVADLKGPGSKVNDVLEELFPVFDVENLPAELYSLARIDLCMGGGTIGPVVAEAPRFQLLNPAGSGKLITLTSVDIGVPGAAIVRWGRQDVPHTSNFSTQIFRDTRHPLGNLPTGQIRAQTSVALANANGQTRVTTNEQFTLTDPNGLAVLTEGTGFEIGVGGLNIEINVTFYWRERVAEPSEVNF